MSSNASTSKPGSQLSDPATELISPEGMRDSPNNAGTSPTKKKNRKPGETGSNSLTPPAFQNRTITSPAMIPRHKTDSPDTTIRNATVSPEIQSQNDKKDVKETKETKDNKKKGKSALAPSKKTGSILKKINKKDPKEETTRIDTLGNPIYKTGGKHKIIFKNQIADVKIVENWKDYNSENYNGSTCYCNIF